MKSCSGQPDPWMDEIPTAVVDPLPPELEAVAAVRLAWLAWGGGLCCAVLCRMKHVPVPRLPPTSSMHTRLLASCMAPCPVRTAPPLLSHYLSAYPLSLSPTQAQGYVVLERPYAFKQWVERYLDAIEGGRALGLMLSCRACAESDGTDDKALLLLLLPHGLDLLLHRPAPLSLFSQPAENYVWMGEPDHLFLKAPPMWATPDRCLLLCVPAVLAGEWLLLLDA